jgi:hypothetical protein
MLMLLSLWCWAFHRKHIHQVCVVGEWRALRCDKCRITWAEPR